MILNITQGHRKWRYSVGHTSLPEVSKFIVTTYLSCTVSEILPLLQCTCLPVTLRSHSVSTVQ